MSSSRRRRLDPIHQPRTIAAHTSLPSGFPVGRDVFFPELILPALRDGVTLFRR